MKYQGTYPKITILESHDEVIEHMNEYAVKITKGNKYTYKNWSSNPNTHKCPLCHPGSGNGWNCIGFAFSCWHHGGNLKSKCNCGVINNGVAETMLTCSAAKALELAQKNTGLKNVKVIRNGGKNIPKSKLKAGDICMIFNGKTYSHTYFYMGDGKLADSTASRSDNIKAGVKFAGRYKNVKVVVRYTGPGVNKRNYLMLGDSGIYVANLQKYLNWALDINLTVNGKFNNATFKALQKFQKKVGLSGTGKCGEKTLAAMKAYDKDEVKKNYNGTFPSLIDGNKQNVVIKIGDKRAEQVKLWQKFLNWYFGHEVCEPDGKFGVITDKYTKEFQEKEIGKGEGDGLVGPKTIAAAQKVQK